jgi:hypothetical protein
VAGQKTWRGIEMEGIRTAFGSTGFDSTSFDLVLIPIIRTDFSIAYYFEG